ncbi:MAG: YncE family protein [Chthoniobacterales bacterium]
MDALRTYSFGCNTFVADALHKRVYATVPAENGIAIFDVSGAPTVTKLFTGSQPMGLALSPEGDLLFVANNGSTVTGISVVDTETLQVTHTISTSQFVTSLAVGKNHVIYASGTDKLLWINGDTGAQLGALGDNSGGYRHESYGEMAITPDRDTLVYGVEGGSGALSRFDVSLGAPVLGETISGGLNGRSTALSPDGANVVFTTDYNMAVHPVAALASTLGTLIVGAYPEAAVYSPDGNTIYASRYDSDVLVFNASTFLETDEFSLAFTSSSALVKLGIDSTGKYLFVTTTEQTKIVDLQPSDEDEPETIAPPVVKIVSPSTPKMTTTRRRIVIKGTASSAVDVQSIECKIGSLPFKRIGISSPWHTTVSLRSGTNIIRFRATDTTGQKSQMVTLKILLRR